ncbi:MAG: YdbL family protein [Smithella sp.]|nr:YdbL family protein [Smithella sp.]
MKKIFRAISYVAVFIVVACVTVNIYFPAAEVQKAADKIVDDIRTGTEGAPAQKSDPTSSLDFILGVKPAYAEVNIDASTPAIRGIKESMKNRYVQLKTFYDKGAIGENNKGLIETRDIAGLNLQERSLVNKLVDQENKDREALYKEIATANKLGADSVPQIKKVFSNSWREKSQSGWWVQSDGGNWEKKK